MQTTDIKTTQNVSIEYELATLWERIIALFIDVIIVMISYSILSNLIIYAFDLELSAWGANVQQSLLPLTVLILYLFFSELITHGRTLGKRALSIQVVRLDGAEPSPGDYFLRSIMHFVDTISTAGILGAALVGSTPKHQRLGDMAAGTTVIKIKAIDRFTLADILRISTIEEYEPQFPAIRQFNESDLLLIKNTLTRYQRFPNSAHLLIVRKLAHRLATQLGTEVRHDKEVDFLKTLIRDYIVLTR